MSISADSISAEPLLSLRELDCRIGNKSLIQLDQLAIYSGEFIALLGPNGAGKSSLLKAISGDLDFALNGIIELHQTPIKDLPLIEKAKHLAVLPQSSQLGFPFNADEVVALGAKPLKLKQSELKASIKNHMQACDCWHLAKHNYLSLSGGERQRVQLARVLLQLSQADKIPLLLLDEPTSAQDLNQQHNILGLVKNLCQQGKLTAIAILHDLNQALHYCDKTAVLADGQLQHFDRSEKIISTQNIKDLWQYQAQDVFSNSGQRFVF